MQTATGRWVFAGVGALLVAYVAGYGIPIVAEHGYGVVALASSAAMAYGLRRNRPEQRRAWRLVFVGIAMWVAGDLVYEIVEQFGEVPWVSVADPVYVAAYGFLLVGVGLLGRQRSSGRDGDAAIDAAAVLVAALLVMWAFVVEPTLSEPGAPWTARALGVGYAIGDAVLIAGVVRVALVRRHRSTAVVLLGASMAAAMAADVAWAVMAQHGDLFGDVVLEGFWLLCYVAAAGAALHPSVSVGDDAAADDAPPGVRRFAITGGALLVPALVGVAEWLINGGAHAEHVVIASGVLAVLAILRLAGLMRDNRRWQREVTSREAFYERVASRSSDAWLVLDADHRVLHASPAVRGLLGYDGDDLGGVSARDYISPAHREGASALVRALQRGAGTAPSSLELELRRADGTDVWFEVRVADLIDDPVVGGIVVNLHDISTRKGIEAELNHQAFHDGLTGLANRALFRDRTGHALDRLPRHGGEVAVLFCDLDGFKTVNDSLGHAAGDQLLIAVADRFRRLVRREDTVARLGGDEFAVLLDGPDAGARAVEVADRLLESMQEPVLLGDALIAPRMSVGVAPGAIGATADEVLRDADIAMYRAKSAGKGRWVRFEAAMGAASADRLALEADLRLAVARDELRLQLQPVVGLADGQVRSFEALVRWYHPQRGQIAPLDFIPLAEEIGTIGDIGQWVLRRACAEAAGWPAGADGTVPGIAVNVSGRELADAAYTGRVEAALAESGLDPSRLVLEITETAVIEDPTVVAARLHQLKALGVRVAVDDFGTGYSSFSYLRQLPIDILKIDRSFIDAVDGDGPLPALVRGLLDLGHTMDMELVAEGIERPQQRRGLAAGGCGMGQGYLFARPLDPADVRTVLAGDGWPARAPADV